MTFPAKLTDTQVAILSAASQREDRCLIAPPNLKGGAAQKVAAKLLAAGLVRETKAKTGMEAWRRNEETGQAYSLKLTAAGLKAIAADEPVPQFLSSTDVAPNADKDPSKAKNAANTGGGPEPDGRAFGDGASPRHEDRARDRIAETRSGRQAGGTDLGHGMAASYRASRADGSSASRL
jgi:hypothetical protein